MDVREAQTAWERVRRAPVARALAVYAGTAFAVIQGADIFTNQFGLPDWFFQGVLVLLLLVLILLLVTAHRYARARRQARSGDGDHGRGSSAGAGRTGTGGAGRAGAEAGGEAPEGASTRRSAESRGKEGERAARDGATTRPRPRRLTWRRLTWGGVMALAGWGLVVAVFMAMRSLGIGPVGTLVGAGVLDARERVILADFESPTGDDLLASAVTEAFRIDLAQSPVVNIVESEYAARALTRMQRNLETPVDLALARELAVREGVKAVIGGEINAVGGGFVLSARLVSAEDGDLLAGFRETASDSAGIIPAIDRLSNRMRERIGESLRTIRAGEPLARVTTSSLEALRRYTQGLRAREQGDYARARELLHEAVALDPEFAMAWRTLGLVAHGRTEQVEALSRAYELRDRLTDRERYLTLGTYYSLVTYETNRAISAYRTLLDTYPDDSWALNNLAVQYFHVRDFERAEEVFARTVAVDSFSSTGHNNLVQSRFALGRTEEARRALARFDAIFPDHPTVVLRRVQMAAALGDYHEAERILRDLAGRHAEPTMRMMAAEYRLALDLLRGRLTSAERRADDLIAGARAMGLQAVELHVELALSLHDLWFRADTAAALRRASATLTAHPLEALDPLDRPYGILAQIYGLSGETDRARGYLSRYEAAQGAELRGQAAATRESAYGLIALAEGRTDDALAALRRSDTGPCPICTLPAMGLAFEAAGQPDSAFRVYEAYATTPWLERVLQDAVWLPHVYERLGELYDERGESEKAARNYARFVELWADADAELQPRVEDARRALSALKGGRGEGGAAEGLGGAVEGPGGSGAQAEGRVSEGRGGELDSAGDAALP